MKLFTFLILLTCFLCCGCADKQQIEAENRRHGIATGLIYEHFNWTVGLTSDMSDEYRAYYYGYRKGVEIYQALVGDDVENKKRVQAILDKHSITDDNSGDEETRLKFFVDFNKEFSFEHVEE